MEEVGKYQSLKDRLKRLTKNSSLNCISTISKTNLEQSQIINNITKLTNKIQQNRNQQQNKNQFLNKTQQPCLSNLKSLSNLQSLSNMQIMNDLKRYINPQPTQSYRNSIIFNQQTSSSQQIKQTSSTQQQIEKLQKNKTKSYLYQQKNQYSNNQCYQKQNQNKLSFQKLSSKNNRQNYRIMNSYFNEQHINYSTNQQKKQICTQKTFIRSNTKNINDLEKGHCHRKMFTQVLNHSNLDSLINQNNQKDLSNKRNEARKNLFKHNSNKSLINFNQLKENSYNQTLPSYRYNGQTQRNKNNQLVNYSVLQNYIQNQRHERQDIFNKTNQIEKYSFVDDLANINRNSYLQNILSKQYKYSKQRNLTKETKEKYQRIRTVQDQDQEYVDFSKIRQLKKCKSGLLRQVKQRIPGKIIKNK